jgi:hypothetical protein
MRGQASRLLAMQLTALDNEQIEYADRLTAVRPARGRVSQPLTPLRVSVIKGCLSHFRVAYDSVRPTDRNSL